MKRRNFPLHGIAMIREYREREARKELLKAKRPIDIIEEQERGLRRNKQRAIELWEKEDALAGTAESNTENLLYFHGYISSVSIQMEDLERKKKVLFEQIKEVQQKYDKTKNDLESVKILKKIFQKRNKKEMQREEEQKLQERILCSRKQSK